MLSKFFRLTVRLSLVVTILLTTNLSLPSLKVEASPIDNNLAPNSAFEQGSASSFGDWILAWSGDNWATLSVENSIVRSGSRAVRIDVSQYGGSEVYFTTYPEEGKIPVDPGTTYRFSAYLKSSTPASLSVVEFPSYGSESYKILPFGGGSGDWQKLEATFTTNLSTTYVSLRFRMTAVGTYRWDDVMLSREIEGRYCVDVRHYVTQSTSGFKLCTVQGSRDGLTICRDGWKDSFNEFISAAEDDNRAPNASFERGSANSVSDWILAWSGNNWAVMSVEPRDEGSDFRAIRIDVSQYEGSEVYFTTYPEEGKIPVDPGITYRFSAYLKSSTPASLSVVEFPSYGSEWYKILPFGGGSGDWQKLEATFTTKLSTTHVSLRLRMTAVGTYRWDNVMLYRQDAVDLARELGRDYTLHNGISGLRIGVHKAYSNPDIRGDGWLCFADRDIQCGAPFGGTNAHYPPLTMDIAMSLPEIQSANLDSYTVTEGAYLLHGWQPSDVRALDPASGSQSGKIRPTVWSRRWAFVVPLASFGADVGDQSSVFVLEEEHALFDATVYSGGQRMERYFYTQGFGLVRAQGWYDNGCEGDYPASCDGYYDEQQDNIYYNTVVSGDYNLGSVVPYSIVNWW